jgi:uncharacterized protein (DUF1501 family)
VTVTRRQFLTGLAGLAGGAALGAVAFEQTRAGGGATGGGGVIPATGVVATSTSTSTSAADSAVRRLTHGQGILVLVTLYGGNDGLSTVVPVGDPAYAPLRGQLAIDPTAALPLREGLALAPELTALKRRWDDGQVAIVRGVSYPNPIRSHFRSMDIWQSADPVGSAGTGWIGRWLDIAASGPLDAVATTPTLPLALLGARTAAAAIPSRERPLPLTGPTLDAWRAMQAVDASGPPLVARAQQSASDLLTVASTVEPALSRNQAAANAKATGPAGSLAAQLDTVSRLIGAGVPTRVFFTAMGGFDTHANEGPTHPQLMRELDTAVGNFLDGLAGDPRGDRVVLMIYSEFGRRPAPDASGGTDHGVAAPVLIAGRAVKGGFVGEEPSLTALDANGDLVWSIDFRSVYSTMLADVLGADPAAILLGTSVPHLDLVRN